MAYITALGVYPEIYSLSYAIVTHEFPFTDHYVCEVTSTINSFPEDTVAERLHLLTDRLISYVVREWDITIVGVTSPFHPEPDTLRLEGAVLNTLHACSDSKRIPIFHLDPRKLHTPMGNEYKHAKEIYTHIRQTVQFPQYKCEVAEYKLSETMAVGAAVTTIEIYDNSPLGNSTYR